MRAKTFQFRDKDLFLLVSRFDKLMEEMSPDAVPVFTVFKLYVLILSSKWTIYLCFGVFCEQNSISPHNIAVDIFFFLDDAYRQFQDKFHALYLGKMHLTLRQLHSVSLYLQGVWLLSFPAALQIPLVISGGYFTHASLPSFTFLSFLISL